MGLGNTSIVLLTMGTSVLFGWILMKATTPSEDKFRKVQIHLSFISFSLMKLVGLGHIYLIVTMTREVLQRRYSLANYKTKLH